MTIAQILYAALDLIKDGTNYSCVAISTAQGLDYVGSLTSAHQFYENVAWATAANPDAEEYSHRGMPYAWWAESAYPDTRPEESAHLVSMRRQMLTLAAQSAERAGL